MFFDGFSYKNVFSWHFEFILAASVNIIKCRVKKTAEEWIFIICDFYLREESTCDLINTQQRVKSLNSIKS